MKHLARALRKNMTDAERRLWSHLRDRQLGGYKFRRQKPIGPFIADFACAKQKLIIEIDGGQHAVNTETDNRRTDYLKCNGWKIIRFWNHEVLNEREAVLVRILGALEPPHPDPLPRGEREKAGAETSSEKETDQKPLPEGRETGPSFQEKGHAPQYPSPQEKALEPRIPSPLRGEG
jgi:adenine-specific DNA-methyltransferase